MISQHFFDSQAELVSALSGSLEQTLAASNKPSPTLYVSGGSTPKALFQKLSQSETIDWDKASIGMVDERYLPESHEDSNAKLIFDNLITGQAEDASFLSYFDDERDAPARAKALNVLMPEILETAEVALLGMGGDFHTASIFPDLPTTAPLLEAESDTLIAANTPTTAPYDRITLTMAGLLRIPRWILHIEGAGKLDVYEQAKASQDFIKHPIAAFLNHPTRTVEVYWCP